ncbi:MAG: HAMP domain-containing histidine kinase [Actinomycetota bacterium]|nr:HAMP domain-containing histidine kinase [Actinomycetota bacterium]
MPRARPRRAALGLRSRIVGVVLVAAVATLAVAAVALLGPLETELRGAALQSLQKDLGKAPTGPLKRIHLADLGVVARERGTASTLRAALRALGSRIGAGTAIQVLGYPGASGRGELLLPPPTIDADLVPDHYDDAAAAFRTHRRVASFGLVGATDVARVAVPFKSDGFSFVLAVRRPAGEIGEATSVVRNAFTTAALAGLVLTLLLGIPLSGRLVRRLRRLRQAALELAEAGPGAEIPLDRARDEVGDLSRTFAIMQARLRHQEEARRAFVATASHELRTPLTSLDGMLELLDEDLRSEAPDMEDARSLLASSRAQSRRLGRLAADLLDLSRIDAEVQLRSEPVELGELSRAVLAEFELGTSERRIDTRLKDGVGPVWVLGDPGSVARILRILLDNAVRISPEGSEIQVECQRQPEPLLRVRDHGPGVPSQERELIFARFHRGRDTSGQAGFGLGLAIGRELAERMGGTLLLEARSEPGAAFVLRLPRARAPEEDAVAVV